MKKIIYILVLISLFGCESNNDIIPNDNNTVHLKISTQVQTRATLVGTRFAYNSEVGLFLTNSSDHISAITSNKDINIMALYKYQTPPAQSYWTYCYPGTKAEQNNISLKKEDGLSSMDLYAYHPHLSSSNNLKAIPYDISTQRDFMYAVGGKANDENSNKDISLNSDEISVPLKFKHVLSCLNFNFTLKNDQNDEVVLNKVRIKSESDNLYKNALLDIRDGNLILSDKINELSLISNFKLRYNNGKATIYSLLLFPMNNAENLNIYLTINSIEISTPIVITKQAFETGKSYSINVEISNFLKFSSITVDDEWKTGNNIDLEI